MASAESVNGEAGSTKDGSGYCKTQNAKEAVREKGMNTKLSKKITLVENIVPCRTEVLA